MADDFLSILASDLIDPPFVLRQVNQRSVEYVEMRDSLAQTGFLNSICVRPSKRQPAKFEIVDGRWRTFAAREAGIVEIPCIVKHGLTDKDVLAMQVTAQALRPTTKPSEFARQIRRLLKSKEGMTQAELCRILHKNPRWVCKMLGMARLVRYKVFRPAIDRGELSLEAAYYLSKLSPVQWGEYFAEATVLPLREFKALIMAVLRRRRMELNAGSLRAKLIPDLEPTPFLRSLTDYLDEIDVRRVGPLVVVAANCKTALDGWYCALVWAIHLDSESVERQRARVLQRLKKRIVQRVEAEKVAPDS